MKLIYKEGKNMARKYILLAHVLYEGVYGLWPVSSVSLWLLGGLTCYFVSYGKIYRKHETRLKLTHILDAHHVRSIASHLRGHGDWRGLGGRLGHRRPTAGRRPGRVCRRRTSWRTSTFRPTQTLGVACMLSPPHRERDVMLARARACLVRGLQARPPVGEVRAKEVVEVIEQKGREVLDAHDGEIEPSAEVRHVYPGLVYDVIDAFLKRGEGITAPPVICTSHQAAPRAVLAQPNRGAVRLQTIPRDMAMHGRHPRIDPPRGQHEPRA